MRKGNRCDMFRTMKDKQPKASHTPLLEAYLQCSDCRQWIPGTSFCAAYSDGIPAQLCLTRCDQKIRTPTAPLAQVERNSHSMDAT